MNFLQFLAVLRARWMTVLSTLLIVIGIAVGGSLVWPKKYTASAELLLDVKSPDPVAGVVLPGLVLPAYMATQVDIINSDSVALRVTHMTRLDQNAEMRQAWQEDTEGRGQLDYWIAQRLQRGLDVKPSRESNVITVSYRGSEPNFAAALANAFAQAYIDQNLALSVEPARQYNSWFEARLQELHGNLEKAQKKLADYQQEHGILMQDDRLDAENQRLEELQNQYVLAIAQNADVSGKQGSGGGDTLPDVMQSGVVMQLKSDIARAEAKLHDLGGNLGQNHPQYQRAESELQELKRQLAQETSRVSHSIDTAGKISHAKADEIHARMDESKKRIMALKKARGDSEVLRMEVESAQRAYDGLAQRQTVNNLNSQNNQTNISVLSPAVPPLEASFPKLLINALIATFLGTMLGIGLAFLREFRDRRVRSREDLEAAFRFPVLAELSA